MTTPASGAESAPKTAVTTPHTSPAVPEGSVVISQAEHDRLNAEARRATSALAKREEADRVRDEAARETAAKEAGDFDEALREGREEREGLRRQLADRDKRDALRDEIEKRGLSGSKARMLTRLADLGAVTDGDASAAVDAVVAEYPDMFSEPETSEEPATPMRRGGPSSPPAAGGSPFEGYISPENYAQTPQKVRLAPDFQKRVEMSRPYWPEIVSAKNFPQG